jgi:hypothetical protein
LGHLTSQRTHRARKEKSKKRCDLFGYCERKGKMCIIEQNPNGRN